MKNHLVICQFTNLTQNKFCTMEKKTVSYHEVYIKGRIIATASVILSAQSN